MRYEAQAPDLDAWKSTEVSWEGAGCSDSSPDGAVCPPWHWLTATASKVLAGEQRHLAKLRSQHRADEVTPGRHAKASHGNNLQKDRGRDKQTPLGTAPIWVISFGELGPHQL
ncbi:hypothetical protein HispidOSU_001187 [Sigmodon hispidus]